MNQVKIKYQIDFTEVFKPLKGKKVYLNCVQLMKQFCNAAGEKIGRVDFDKSGCREKLGALNNILLNESNLKNAFQEARDEIEGIDDEVWKEMNLWQDDREEIMERLSEKFIVTSL